MLTLDQLANMTGPEILAYCKAHPGELDALAAEAQGWFDRHPRKLWEDYISKIYSPTTDANQTRKLVAAVREASERRGAMNPGEDEICFRTIESDFEEKLCELLEQANWMDARTDFLIAPLPLVTAAAVCAMGDS